MMSAETISDDKIKKKKKKNTQASDPTVRKVASNYAE